MFGGVLFGGSGFGQGPALIIEDAGVADEADVTGGEVLLLFRLEPETALELRLQTESTPVSFRVPTEAAFGLGVLTETSPARLRVATEVDLPMRTP